MAVPASPPPVQPASVPPLQKTNVWIFIAAAIVVLCCACFGVAGLLIAFGPDVLHELGWTALQSLVFA